MPLAVVYGGCGALGATVVRLLKERAWRVVSIDLGASADADASVVAAAGSAGLAEQGAQVVRDVGAALGGAKADAVLCVAGGWQGGNAASAGFLESAERSIGQSVATSLVAAAIAAQHLRPAGLLVLTGAALALDGGTPGMVGYGMAKAAVHHMVASLAMPGSGVDGARVAAILPQTLDTPANRSAMPAADTSAWTPLADAAALLLKWAEDPAACENGRLYRLVTRNGATTAE
ncbi:hypothetical protein H4R18_004959 [Coemansia javaensis]|uniref:Dihydropteridine reductase n=1 Tax=Coemansia javaensis TaxID=2761396 RepID=A0A9W8LFJ7_9FUNG|nr:hypothetical protein H4R18_004959 [Coemansia javaensis]